MKDLKNNEPSLQDIANANPKIKTKNKKEDEFVSDFKEASGPSLIEVIKNKTDQLKHSDNNEFFYTALSVMILIAAIFIHSLIFGVVLVILALILRKENKKKALFFGLCGLILSVLFLLNMFKVIDLWTIM